jgi:RHS repeat-associated protein
VEFDSTTDLPLSRYQVSGNLELDDRAKIISYEEFSPYGATTYRSARTEAPRRYRFAGYQRDCETGLYHCGERYYAPWLGRWISADPIGIADGLNVFSYVRNDPVNFDDHCGTSRAYIKPTPRSDRPTPASAGGAAGRVAGGVAGDNPKPAVGPRDGFTSLHRATAAERASKFVNEDDLDAICTNETGDFNHAVMEASYWTDNWDDAVKQMQMANSGRAIITILVPAGKLVPSDNVHQYFDTDAKWQEVCTYSSVHILRTVA